MKYIRTYETEEKFLTDKDSTSRGFRLKPTLYKYSEAGDHVHLELDDPRKHGDSTYMEITLDSDVEFSFYIGNKTGDTQTTMTCTIDWGDDTVETKTITKDDKGFKLAHNYVAGSYKIELYGVERDYSIVGNVGEYISLISPTESVERVVLGNSVVSIGVVSFYNCISLTSINIPNSVTLIDEGAFDSCESLTSVYIPEGVTSIAFNTFYGCSSLTSVYIPEGVTSIAFNTFYDCSSLTSVYIPEGVTSIEDSVFYGCTSLTSVHIPEGVTSIGYNAFRSCSSLTSINIPEGVTSIGYNAFRSCSSLTSINIPNSVNSIEHNAFEECSSLTSIDIPESVTIIRSDTFKGCSSLSSIHIPESVTSIEMRAFERCSALISISSLNTTAPTLGNNVFTNLPANGTLHIKPGATGYDVWLSLLPSGWVIVEDL